MKLFDWIKNKKEDKNDISEEDTKIETDRFPICGGTSRSIDENAPKTIISEEMYLFDVFSSFITFSMNEDGKEQLDYIHAFAAKAGEGYLIDFTKIPRTGENKNFTAIVEEDPFPDLVSFVKEFNIAQNNGKSSFTNGLPENFGGTISIKYKGGEKIRISNNQSPVLSIDGGRRLSNIFSSLEKGPKIDLKSSDEIKKIIFKDDTNENDYQHCNLDILEDGSGKSFFEIKLEEYDPSSRVSDVSQETIAKIKNIIDHNCMLGWPGLPESEVKKSINRSIKTITFVFGDGSEITVGSLYELPSGLDRAFFNIELEMR